MTAVVSKQPGEARILAFEFADALASGVTISSITSVTTASGGLVSGSALITLGTPAIDGTDVRVIVSGGTSGESYPTRCLIVDSDGQTLELDAIVAILADPDPDSAGLVVEDGSYVPTANSYATVAEADIYLRARGRASTWDAYSTEAKAGYLIDATAYLDAHVQWRGVQISTAQALGWPRGGVVNRYGVSVSASAVPDAVKAAVIEIAAQGAPAVTASRVKDSVTVGPISTTYAPGTDPAQGIAKHKYALRLLDGLVVGGVGNAIRLVRA